MTAFVGGAEHAGREFAGFDEGDDGAPDDAEIGSDKVGPVIEGEFGTATEGAAAHADAEGTAGLALGAHLGDEFVGGVEMVFGGAADHDEVRLVIGEGAEKGAVGDVGAEIEDFEAFEPHDIADHAGADAVPVALGAADEGDAGVSAADGGVVHGAGHQAFDDGAGEVLLAFVNGLDHPPIADKPEAVGEKLFVDVHEGHFGLNEVVEDFDAGLLVAGDGEAAEPLDGFEIEGDGFNGRAAGGDETGHSGFDVWAVKTVVDLATDLVVFQDAFSLEPGEVVTDVGLLEAAGFHELADRLWAGFEFHDQDSLARFGEFAEQSRHGFAAHQ